MTSLEVWVGLDVGLRESGICAIDGLGNVLFQTIIETCPNAIAAVLSAYLPDNIRLVGMEAGSVAGTLAADLKKLGLPMAVFETYKVSKFLALRGIKSDLHDAHGLAEIARLGQATVPQVLVKIPEMQLLRSQMILRASLVRQRLAVLAIVRSLIRLHGGRLQYNAKSARFSILAAEEVARLAAAGIVDLRLEVLPLLDLAGSFDGQIVNLTKRLHQIAKSNSICRRLMTVPGVGPICAISFYTAVSEPSRFKSPRSIGSYFGLVPRLKESGDFSRLGSITKMGNKVTRTHLQASAAVMLGISKKDSALRNWGLNLSSRTGRAKAQIAVARKLAVLLLTLWQQDRDFVPFPNL